MKKIFSQKNKVLAGCLLMFVSILVVSCKKLIEIPSTPPTNITRQQAFADSATAMSAIAGVYTYTITQYGQGNPYYNGYFEVATALSGNEVHYNGTGDYGQFSVFTLTPQNNEINSMWITPYTGIYQVNDVLDGITNNSNLSASFIKQITGEMKVVRAFYYFNLINAFGNVPLVTNTDYATNAGLPQSPKSAIYTQILTDLNDAVKKLPVAYPTYPPASGVTQISTGHTRPNLYTAQALQAKVNLYQGNWQAAYNEADSVIKSGKFSLLSNLGSVFLDGSNEAIWQVQVQQSTGGTGDAINYYPYSNTIIPTFTATDSLVNRFETGDIRKSSWIGANIVGGKTYNYIAKYRDRTPTTPATDFMMLRYAEMYLIRAEAAAQLNNLSVAVADINTIRQRANLIAVNPTTQTTVLAAIRQERRVEMFTEFGSRFFDLNRTSTDTKYPASGQAAAVLAGWTTNFAVYPVSIAQLKLNSNLTPNPGYH